ncbi:MAG: aminotransferase class V-fold PLP-dependent enzyme, partial [Victivallaceae bacterium]
MIYFDHAAATVPEPELLQEFAHYPAEFFYNPESVHPGALALRDELNRRREQLAVQLFGAKRRTDEFYFGAGASEVFNLLAECCFPESGNIVSTQLEHPAAKYNLARLPGEKRFLPVDEQGRILSAEVSGVIDKYTSLVIFHQVHNELGTIQDWAGIIAAIRAINSTAMIVVDAVQAAGKLPLCSEADMLVLSGHKFGAVAGGGAAIFNCRSRYAQG